MGNIDSNLRYEIIDDDFNIDNKCSFAFYDGANFSGSIMNYNLFQRYANGDEYERIYEKGNNDKIIKVIIKFYEKKSNIIYSCEKEIKSDVIYKKTDSSRDETISKEEFEDFVINFIAKNN